MPVYRDLSIPAFFELKIIDKSFFGKWPGIIVKSYKETTYLSIYCIQTTKNIPYLVFFPLQHGNFLLLILKLKTPLQSKRYSPREKMKYHVAGDLLP
jgi:hypothetical protein